ncbi:MAG: FAD-binding protein [Candidatus Endonucleobacter bathymodioli]|uniref:Electron transfer flavoprotein subunit alpha n=1 Tax=Candidatus Endonucleibacter bathymodioli TaxID=539814 RepID=A0AA90NYT5_9GAMM|nr:FAD-binding protein [Candidatus Endonucleobacter bathymodioli]
MRILVVADHDNKSLNGVTLSTISAARTIDTESEIHLLIIGAGCDIVSEEAAEAEFVSKVLVVNHLAYEHHLAENTSQLVAEIGKGYSHILTAATTTGKNFMPRVAALLDVDQISEIIRIDNKNTFARMVYAGNAIATVESSATVKVITVRTTAFDPVSAKGGRAVIEKLDSNYACELSSFIGEELSKSDRPELIEANIVISGGRGMGSCDNFELLYKVANKLGAAVGASRAAVDAGYAPNDMQVGQTGKIVAPNLYIAVGISGAIQHMAGMKDSKIIVAINKDGGAPIFQVADYGLVADLFEVLPELEDKL